MLANYIATAVLRPHKFSRLMYIVSMCIVKHGMQIMQYEYTELYSTKWGSLLR